MLGFYGFYEPDGFYYFTAMRAIVNNGFSFPSVLGISGYPQHAPIAEAHGMYYLVLIPYAILGHFGITYYTIMRLIPIVFGLLDMLGAYLLSRYISKDKLFGSLVLMFVALSMANAARTSALVFRGDSFVTFFLLVALILFVEVFRQTDQKKRIIVAVAAGIGLALCNMVWSGAAFGDITFILAFVILLSYAFIARKEKLVNDGMYILLSILVWYIVCLLVFAVGFIPGEQLVDASFIPIFICIALFWGLLYILPARMEHLVRDFWVRVGILLAIVVIGLGLFALVQPGTIYNIFVGNGFVYTASSFGSTTEELQPPTFQFLFTSFGPNLFTSLPSLAFSLTSYFGLAPNPPAFNLWTSLYGVLGVVLVLILFIPYMFMQVYDSSGFFKGKPKLLFDVSVPMAVLTSYFVITAFLEMHAIRFNSLLSIPVAIMGAYSLYWLALAANSMKSQTIRYAGLIACAIVIVLVFYFLYSYASLYSSSLTQADSINPQFISALQWLKANSANNSVVLTLWPDGSVVEAVANRTSVMDSVGSENGSKAIPFAAWLFNDSSDPQFLESSIAGRPNYLLVRTPWLIETQGIFTEANFSSSVNESLYGYAPLTSFSESQANSTARQLVLRINGQTQYPSVLVDLGYSNDSNAVQSIQAELELNGTTGIPFGTIGLEDQYGNYTYVEQEPANRTNGELLIVQYSTIPRAQFFMNVTGAYVFGPGIGQSNMAKFLFLCGAESCAWDNSMATMRLVYQNSDTRIFSITYNSTV